MRKAELHHINTILTKGVQLLAYFDDIDIIRRAKSDVTAAFTAIELKSANMVQAVNAEKTKHVLSTWYQIPVNGRQLYF